MSKRHQGDILEEEVLNDLKKLSPWTQKTINSGALRGDGDIHTPTFCVDTKDKSSNSSFIATRDEMEKCKKQGVKSGRVPVLVVANKEREKAVILSYDSFLKIVHRLDSLHIDF